MTGTNTTDTLITFLEDIWKNVGDYDCQDDFHYFSSPCSQCNCMTEKGCVYETINKALLESTSSEKLSLTDVPSLENKLSLLKNFLCEEQCFSCKFHTDDKGCMFFILNARINNAIEIQQKHAKTLETEEIKDSKEKPQLVKIKLETIKKIFNKETISNISDKDLKHIYKILKKYK